jgi:hypothetical protein
MTVAAAAPPAAASTLPEVTPSRPSAAAEGVADITRTRRGAGIAFRAAARLAARGWSVHAGDLRVWRDAAGFLVAGRTATLAPVPARRADGSAGVELVPVVGGVPGAVAPRSAAPLVEPPVASWSFVSGACFERLSDNWAWIDHCAHLYRLVGDGDGSRDYYALDHLATAGPNWPWVLKTAGIGAYPVETSPPMSWLDWSPRSDRTGPCQSYLVRLTVPFAALSHTVDRCETWDISKAQRGGDFRLDWSGCACTQDRELAFDIAVSVGQGRGPIWYVPAEVRGFAF